MVEPAPRDTEVLRGCGFAFHCSAPAGPSCHRCAPTCLETESNLAPYMAVSHRTFSVCKHMRQPCDFNFYMLFGMARPLLV